MSALTSPDAAFAAALARIAFPRTQEVTPTQQAEAYANKRAPVILAEMETDAAALELALHDVDFSDAMHAAYRTGDTAELGRLVAAAIHDDLTERADTRASDEAGERYGV